MRVILYLILILLLYHAVKAVIRSATAAYHRDESRAKRLSSSDMVLDPNCRTYVVKERAVARRSGGSTEYFCSETCAEEYRKKTRS